MKKQLSLLMLAAAIGATAPAVAATNSGVGAASTADFSNRPAVRARENVNYNKYETKTTTTTYRTNNGRNTYYTQPAKRSDLYKQYDTSNTSRSVMKTRTETYRTTAKRKYFLSHPFFQPVEGKFGSITDISFNSNSFDLNFNLNPAFAVDAGGAGVVTNGSWKSDIMSVKEDFSFGITERVAIVGMLKYDASDYELDWDGKDTLDDNGINLYGIGGQWRFVDNTKWIATLSGWFQHQKDTANNFILDLKGGYKVNHTTIYGLGRLWYVDIDGDSYGYGMTNADNTMGVFIANATDTSSAVFVEGGIGAFSVLDQDWTLNIEATFGNYDWHNQLALRGAFGWQPNDWFAVNIYGKIALHDSADGQDLKALAYGFWDNTLTPPAYNYSWEQIGTATVDGYSETTIGAQVIFMF